MTSHTVEPRLHGTSRPVSPLRARRTAALYLTCHFALCLLLEWRFLVEPMEVVGLMVDIGGPAMSRSERARIAKALAAMSEGGDCGSPPNPGLLLDRTRWFCQLRLPSSEDELLAPGSSDNTKLEAAQEDTHNQPTALKTI